MNTSPTAIQASLTAFFTAFQNASHRLGDEMKSFFQQFERDYRAARKSRAATTPHLDLLRVFGLEFAELRHSDVLAWFLKPTAEHEQGPFFLNALLHRLGLEPIANESDKVLRERHHHTDVATYGDGRFAVFIENKVRCFERPDQVSDVVNSLVHASRELLIPRERRFAIFLSDKGIKPSTGPKEDSSEFLLSNLKPWSRVQLFDWFREDLEARGQANYSPLLMNFLDSYLNAIRRNRAHLS